MDRIRPAVAAVTVLALAVLVAAGLAGAAAPIASVDVSQRHFNESEEAIAVNPTNPNNIVIVTNVGHREAGLTAGMFEAVSFDGGATWSRYLIGNNNNLGDACCDPSLSFDQYGNLFLTYLYEAENEVPIALSTDGGLTFNVIANVQGAAERDADEGGRRQPRPLPLCRPADDHDRCGRGLGRVQCRRPDVRDRRSRDGLRPGWFVLCR